MKARVHKHGAVAAAASELLVTPSGLPRGGRPFLPLTRSPRPVGAWGAAGLCTGSARRAAREQACASVCRKEPQPEPSPRSVSPAPAASAPALCPWGARAASGLCMLRVAPCLLVMWALKSRFLCPRPLPGPGPAQQLRGSSCPPVTVAPRTGRGGLQGEQSYQLQHRAWAVLSRGRPRWTLPRGVPPTLQVRVRRWEEGQL